MENLLRAIEVSGTLREGRDFHLDAPVEITGSKRVRAIILVPDQDEIDDMEWARAASKSPAFDFLNDPEEDIYTMNDGKPFHDEKDLPTYLLCAVHETRAFHIVFAVDVRNKNIRVVTAYYPNPDTWEDDLKTRRKNV